jgi:thioredoxin 2
MQTAEVDVRGIIVGCPRCGQQNRLPYDKVGERAKCPRCGSALHPPSVPLEVDDEDAFRELVMHSELPILVDFWASWCGPCLMVAPEIARVAEDEAGRWLVVKISTEDLPQVAQRFQISAIPTLVLLKEGRQLARQSGAMPADAVRRLLRENE